MTYIDEHQHLFGVEPICRTLTQHGWPIASGTYRAYRRRLPSARARRDAWLAEQIRRVHAANYRVYGARKLWKAATRAGWDVGHDQVARLMRAEQIAGAVRTKRVRTTRPDPLSARHPDLVKRNFTARHRTSCGSQT